MRGDYSTDAGARPRFVCAAGEGDCGDDPPSRAARQGRLFLCARCRTQALICSFCDRGQVYCAGDCARGARRRTLHAAGRRYQNSHQGRRVHAARTARYRARQKKVTHHGSPKPPTDDLLPPGSPEHAGDPAFPEDWPRRAALHCHWCGRRCADLVRQGFLRRRIRRRRRRDQRGSEYGHTA
jgi:hypothetical protein